MSSQLNSKLLRNLELKVYALQQRLKTLVKDGDDGVWRTVRGRRVFIREGESVQEALRRSLRTGYRKEAKKVAVGKTMQELEDLSTAQDIGGVSSKGETARLAIKTVQKQHDEAWFGKVIGSADAERLRVNVLSGIDTVKATTAQRKSYEQARGALLDVVNKAFRSASITQEEFMLHRGAPIGLKTAEGLAKHFDSGKGVVFSFKEYASASGNRGTADHFAASWRDSSTGLRGQGATISFLVPKGSTVLPTLGLNPSKLSRREMEFFVPKGTAVKIVGYKREGLDVGAHSLSVLWHSRETAQDLCP